MVTNQLNYDYKINQLLQNSSENYLYIILKDKNKMNLTYFSIDISS